MKLLFDQNTPAKLRYVLSGHHIETAAERGWQELKNGELLRAAEESGFDVLISADKNMQYQNTLSGRSIAVLALSTNNWPLMRNYTGIIAQAVVNTRPGTFVIVECGHFLPHKLRTR